MVLPESRTLTSERIDALDAMWAAVCGPDAQAGPGTRMLLREVLDSIPALIATARLRVEDADSLQEDTP